MTEFESKVRYLTTRIGIGSPVAGSEPKSFGTGFFVNVSVPNGDPGEWMTLLFSNKHVYDHDTGIYLLLHKLNEQRTGPVPGGYGKYYWSDFLNVYHEHPNEDLDLSCINLAAAAQQAGAFFQGLPLECIKRDASYPARVGQEVIFVGYPGGEGADGDIVYPQIRRGIIATSPSSDEVGEHIFLIDGEVVGGCSGSPVFVVDDGVYYFLGVIFARVRQKNQGVVIKPKIVAQFVEHCMYEARNELFRAEGRTC